VALQQQIQVSAKTGTIQKVVYKPGIKTILDEYVKFPGKNKNQIARYRTQFPEFFHRLSYYKN